MRYGIPAYRLPRDVLDAELDRITELGVRIAQRHRVADLPAERSDGSFDAGVRSRGCAPVQARLNIPAGDAARIVDAVSFLRSVAEGERPMIGRRVAVYGAATPRGRRRVARGWVPTSTLIVYRRTRDEMPAHEQRPRTPNGRGCG